MRIATWNVNSLKARMEKVEWWLDRAQPDVALLQETKLGDSDAPVMAFAMAGYDLIHHGEGRWNGVAVAVRQGIAVSDIVTNFGDRPVRDSGPGSVAAAEEDFDPLDERVEVLLGGGDRARPGRSPKLVTISETTMPCRTATATPFQRPSPWWDQVVAGPSRTPSPVHRCRRAWSPGGAPRRGARASRRSTFSIPGLERVHVPGGDAHGRRPPVRTGGRAGAPGTWPCRRSRDRHRARLEGAAHDEVHVLRDAAGHVQGDDRDAVLAQVSTCLADVAAH